MANSFANKKALRFAITLGQGTFSSSSSQVDDSGNITQTSLGNTITLEGLRATVDVDKAGGVQMNTLRANIYGVSQANMNSLTSLQYQPQEIIRNSISVYALDGQRETRVFLGNIANCWANYGSMPEVFLEIQAFAGFINQVTPVSPTSLPGPVNVAQLMGELANQMGYTFENAGVQTVLPKVYLPGTLLEQANSLAQQAGVDLYLDDETLCITPAGTPRTSGNLIPEVSAATGLVGYPSFGADGRGPSIVLQTLHNPAIRFGGQIKVVTGIQPAITQALTVLPPAQRANGVWIVNSIGHHLQSETPGGAWFSRVSCGKQKIITGV